MHKQCATMEGRGEQWDFGVANISERSCIIHTATIATANKTNFEHCPFVQVNTEIVVAEKNTAEKFYCARRIRIPCQTSYLLVFIIRCLVICNFADDRRTRQSFNNQSANSTYISYNSMEVNFCLTLRRTWILPITAITIIILILSFLTKKESL